MSEGFIPRESTENVDTLTEILELQNIAKGIIDGSKYKSVKPENFYYGIDGDLEYKIAPGNTPISISHTLMLISIHQGLKGITYSDVNKSDIYINEKNPTIFPGDIAKLNQVEDEEGNGVWTIANIKKD